MFESCLEKQRLVKENFSSCLSIEQKYEKIMEMGKNLSPLDPLYKNDGNLVEGCQSRMYLISHYNAGKITFEAESEALISAGLAALLISVYSEESPEAILKCSPTFLDELGIPGALTPGRSNGLYSLHLQMKRLALSYLLQ